MSRFSNYQAGICCCVFFFFQAEDGIRDLTVTGVQTCALPILPVSKRAGDKVIGATLNTNGALVMRSERIGSDTVLSQIVQMVAQAQRSKAPMQRMADVVAGYFVMAVVAIAVTTLFVWGFFGPQPTWVYGLINAV